MSARRRRLRLTNLLPGLAPLAAILLAITFVTTNGAQADDEPDGGPSSLEGALPQTPFGGYDATDLPQPAHISPYGATPTVTATPPPTSSTAPTACSVRYQVVNEWHDGFQAGVTVRNDAGTVLDGWALTWQTPTPLTITNVWNATGRATGLIVTMRNVAWNGAVAPGTTVSFGFTASTAVAGARSATASGPSPSPTLGVSAPAAFFLNARPCAISATPLT